MADALHLERLPRRFRTVLDCGLFHTFDDDERHDYAASLASALDHGGMLYVLCFSDTGPEPGPHPVSRESLSAPFDAVADWHIDSIESDSLRTRFSDATPAWLAIVHRR